MRRTIVILACVLAVWASVAARLSPVQAQQSSTPATGAAVYNIRVATDASPDLTDLDSFIGSTTARWSTDEEKVWALFYWSHILKRQTSPIVLHGFEVTDPIRNFADYGFAMCSTISGINQTLYERLGLQHQYWDVCNHTVSQVFFNNRWRMIDSSMSALVTLDDGVTLASLQEAAANGARLVKERSLYATSRNGFLTGSDTMRSLPSAVNPTNGSTVSGFADAYCEPGLKYRDYYYNWTSGHRTVLNVRENESYTRYYGRLGEGPAYYVSSEQVAASDPANTFENDKTNRFGLRGNGRWTFAPSLASGSWERQAYQSANVAAYGDGIGPAAANQNAEVIYKVQAANAITSQQVRAQITRTDAAATAAVALSVNGGVTWTDVATAAAGASVPMTIDVRDQVNAEYETLWRVRMRSTRAGGVVLTGFTVDTITQVNAKALPRLNVGRNEVYIGAGDQSDTMVLWPDLRADRWKQDVDSSSNIASQSVTVPRKYTAVVYPSTLTQDAHLTYRMTAPADFTRVTYGGRLHNFRAGSYIDFLHSFDNGATWVRSYRYSDIAKPYDVVHYETVNVPAGVRTVLFRFLMHNTNPDVMRATGLYNVRMEGNYATPGQTTPPMDVTLRWNEVRVDRTLVARSHKQRVTTFPSKYVVNVGGSDHPVMESMTLALAGAGSAGYGYNDGVDAGGSKYVHRTRTDGTQLAVGRPYTISRAPSGFQSSPGSSNTTILTDGVVGAPATGSIAYWWGQCWTSGSPVDLRVDLGSAKSVGVFRTHLFGSSAWDALKGQVKDTVEVLTSTDGVTYTSRGFVDTALWRKDVPINHMLQDDETATGWNFELALPSPVSARYVKYAVTPKRNLCISELQVLDRVTYSPFDIRIALPDAYGGTVPGEPEPPVNQPPSATLTSPSSGSVTAPATIAFAASAEDPDGSVTRVEFLANGVVVASDTTAPFSASWTAETAGDYTLTARAVDDKGASTTTSAATVTVTPSGSVPGEDIVLWAAEAPVKTGWTPTTDASAAGGRRLQSANDGQAKVVTPVAAPARYFEVTFDATAGRGYRLWMRGKAISNAAGNDSVHVQFDGTVDTNGQPAYRIGTTTGIEYNLEDCAGCGIAGWGWQDNGWGGPDVLGPLVYFQVTGRQRMRVQVREDGLGIDQIVLSSTRWVDRAPGPQKNDTTILPKTGDAVDSPPTVAITAPQSGTTVDLANAVEITANAADADGPIARVDFLVDGHSIASDTSAPFSTSWRPSAAGRYTLTARARDGAGNEASSLPVDVVVTAAGGGEDVVLYVADAPIAVNWAPVTDATAAGGRRLQNDNLGDPKILQASVAPGSYFELTFNALAGRPYRIWIRGKALANNAQNDSVFVQFDDSLDAGGQPAYRIGTTSSVEYNLEECASCGLSGWGWQDNGWGAPGLAGPTISFNHDGLQTIRVQVREDGLGIDQIVLSSVRWLNTAPGPAKKDTTILPR